MEAVGFARSSGLQLPSEAGDTATPGHSVCDGGIVIDLGPMKGIRVDPEARTVRVQAGVLWRARPRDPGVRARDDGRNRHPHRRRRPDARRWYRLASSQARADDRPARLGRSGHRRGRPRQGQRDRRVRALLGPARRWRQLRDRHRVRVSPAPGRPGRACRTDLLADRGRARAPTLPRVDRGCARRADDVVVQRKAPAVSFVSTGRKLLGSRS